MIRGEDFPDGMSAVMIKEMRQSLRSRSFTLTFACYHILLIAILLISFSTEAMSQAIIFTAALPMLIIPALHAGDAINSEIRQNTLPMLFLTRLTSWRIVTGKWLSASLVGVLFLTSSLPYAVARYFIAKGNFLEDVLILILFCLLGAVMAATNLCLGSAHPNFASGSMLKRPRGGGILILILMFIFGPMLLSGFVMRGMMRGGGGFSSGSGLESGLVWGALLTAPIVIFLMLKLATAGMAPSSENHVRGRRLCVLAALICCAIGDGFFPILAMVWGLVLLVDLFAPEGRNAEAVRPLTRSWLRGAQELYFAPRLFSAFCFHLVGIVSLGFAYRADLPMEPLCALGLILLIGEILSLVLRQIGAAPVIVLVCMMFYSFLAVADSDYRPAMLWVPLILAPLGMILHFAYRQHVILLFLLAEFLLFIACLVMKLNPFERDVVGGCHVMGLVAMIPFFVLLGQSGANHLDFVRRFRRDP